MVETGVSQRRACVLLGTHRSTCRYTPRPSRTEEPLPDASIERARRLKDWAARAGLPAAAAVDELAAGLKILANQARLRLLLALEQHELCVCDCAKLLGQSLSAASQHLKELRRIGAVHYRQEGRLAIYRLANDRWSRVLRDLLASDPAPVAREAVA